ncbi:MAG: hypothetical protein J1G06_09275 [Oscillospiraceae bacterium]|nr:hypothetical protein [Oscillospiraceae bacterium]
MHSNKKDDLIERIKDIEEQFIIFKKECEDRINNVDSGMLDDHLSNRLTAMERSIKDLTTRLSALEGD